jgi:hypothetical protein
MPLSTLQTRIVTQSPLLVNPLPACAIVLAGSLLLGGAATRTQTIAVDAALNNAYIVFNACGGVSPIACAAFLSFDISNKAAPVLQGQMAAGADHNIFEAMCLGGTVAYCGGTFGDGEFDVTSIDVSNPLVPTRISTLVRGFPLGQPVALSVVGTTLYLVTNNSRFSLIDVTNPAAMVALHNYSFLFDFGVPSCVAPTSLVAIGLTVYVLSYNQGGEANFGIYDVTNPLAVIERSVTTLIPVTSLVSELRSSLQVVGATAYTLSDDQFIILNVTVPTVPIILSTTTVIGDNVSPDSTASGMLFVNAAGTRAFILNQQTRSMYIYDVSNPVAPVLLATTATKTTSSPEGVVGSGNFIFTAETEAPAGSTQGWLEIFDSSGCV